MLMGNLQLVWHLMVHFLPALCSVQKMLLPRDSWGVWPSEPETKITPLLDDHPTHLVACTLIEMSKLQ
jgi:hypothetical protein